MEGLRKPAYWAVLPAKVRYDTELRPNAKLLYAEITALADATGYCWASNEYLGQLFGIASRTVSDLVTTLHQRGYIIVEVLRDPRTNEVIERRIWVDKPAIPVEAPPHAKNGDTPIAENDVTPHAKNGDTPIAENDVTPHAKNGDKNNLNSFNNTPIVPKRGRKKQERKQAPDWKPERFDAFWKFYSKKARGEAKQAAIRAWDKLRPDDELISVMAKALQRQLESEDWQRGFGIPYASTWLNNARWEDEPKASLPQGNVPDGLSGRRVVEEPGVRYI